MDKLRYINFTLKLCFVMIPSAMAGAEMVTIPGGSYSPFLKTKVKDNIKVESFLLDSEPVTKREFLGFVTKNPEWRKSRVKKIFADRYYLKNWKSDLVHGGSDRSPVTFVSWFAADAFCRAKGETLPTTNQWEYAAYDRGQERDETTRKILNWYSEPNPTVLPTVGKSGANGFGVHDLFGLIWEWSLDFAGSFEAEGESGLVCGGAGQAGVDPSDYATFMRYSFRSSLKANYSVSNLGFRCAKSSQ